MPRVLVVDDEPPVLSALEIALADAGLEPVPAESAEEGIENLERSAFDAVVVDKNLPGKSGLDLVRWIRARNRTVPLIVMTAYVSAETAKEALNLGIDRYIEKPFANIYEVPELLGVFLQKGRPGWLPSQARTLLPTAPLPAKTRPLRILLGTGPSNAALLGDPVLAASPPSSTLDRREAPRDLLVAFESSPRPDLVLLDADFYPALAEVILAVRTREERVEIVVTSSIELSVSVLQDMIRLGVTQIVDRVSGDYSAQIIRVVRGL